MPPLSVEAVSSGNRCRNSIASNSRILFAISEGERSLFLPDFSDENFPCVDIEWMEPLGGTKGLEEKLRNFQPTVLVSCWSTPRLPEALDRSLHPDYICHLSGSIRSIVPRTYLEKGILVTNWGDAVCRQVAEHGLLLALLALRNGSLWRSFIQDMAPTLINPAIKLQTRTLFERKVGIHGFGRVARTLIDLLKPFEIEISAYSEGVPSEFIKSRGVHPCSSLEELFRSSEVLFECEALTPKTSLSVSGAILGLLPDDAIFVNIGRGMVVDEAALANEAASERIRIALDVVQEEPMTSASSIFANKTAIFSPHIAGPTADRYKNCGLFALNNIKRHLSGLPVLARVTLSDYDRST